MSYIVVSASGTILRSSCRRTAARTQIRSESEATVAAIGWSSISDLFMDEDLFHGVNSFVQCRVRGRIAAAGPSVAASGNRTAMKSCDHD